MALVEEWKDLAADVRYMAVRIFETADAPEHMWHPGPGSGGYRELWRRTIAVTPAR